MYAERFEKCPRCEGLLITERNVSIASTCAATRFISKNKNTRQDFSSARSYGNETKCVNCGWRK